MKRNNIKRLFNFLLVLLIVCSGQLYAQNNNTKVVKSTINIVGKVMDNDNEPLTGVTVKIVGSTKGVLTDLDGTFKIEVSSSDKLEASYIGMQTKTIVVGSQTSLIIIMEPKVSELDDVTVVAYGRQKKASVIGSISSVSMEDLKLPVGQLSNALAGQMAGIVSIKGSGEPGVGADFWIRGISTFGANNRPLILVDGIERPLDLVDVDDVATFSILKDATATAVYGVRGANGIVLITTKRGKESSKPNISVRFENGLMAPMMLPELANGEQFIDYYNDIMMDNSHITPIPDYIKQKYLNGSDPDLYPNVNWINTIFKEKTTNQKLNVNITGGGKSVRYYIAGSYYNENGIFNAQKNEMYDASVRYDRFNFRSNVDIDITPTTKLELNLSNQYEVKKRLGGTDMAGMWSEILQVSPIATPLVFSNGLIAEPDKAYSPYYDLNYRGFSQDFTNTAQSLMSFTQDFSGIVTKGLEFNAKFAWDAANYTTIDKLKSPTSYHLDPVGRDENGELILIRNGTADRSDYLSLARSNGGTRSYNFETSVIYNNVFNDKHRIGGLFLFNMREYTNLAAADLIQAFPNRNIGVAGRATYSFKDTYFIEGNFGYNGSENFAPKHRFGFFPSIALGYLVSSEDYFQQIFPYIDLLKLKCSYGLIGNDKIGGSRRFAFNSEMNSSASGYLFGMNGNNNVGGIATSFQGNTNVTWETAKKTNVGIELGILKKIKIQADYFFEKREGIFVPQQSVISIFGLNVRDYVNIGSMQNQGVDGSLEYNQKFGDFSLQARGNFTFNRNKLLYDDKPTPVWAYQSNVNMPYEQQRGYVSLGLFESQYDIDHSPDQAFLNKPVPGDIKYKDINGDGKIDNFDVVPIGYSVFPEINYGFGLSGMWKGLDCSVFFQGVDHVTKIIGGRTLYGSWGQIISTGQIFKDVAVNRWKLNNPDPNAIYPRMSTNERQINKVPSTYWQRNMSFLRFKNMEIGYTIPGKYTKRIGMSTMRIYLQGVNLLSFSKFKLWDPELDTYDGGKYPQMKTISLGLNINI